MILCIIIKNFQGQWDVYVPLVFSQFFKHFWYISPCLVHKYLILDSEGFM